MHPVTQIKTNDSRNRPIRATLKSNPRPPVWRPEPSGLTRAELRQIVLDTLG